MLPAVAWHRPLSPKLTCSDLRICRACGHVRLQIGVVSIQPNCLTLLPADLWICLICGHVGCGRYRGSHAAAHWQASGHGYALELETQVHVNSTGLCLMFVA